LIPIAGSIFLFTDIVCGIANIRLPKKVKTMLKSLSILTKAKSLFKTDIKSTNAFDVLIKHSDFLDNENIPEEVGEALVVIDESDQVSIDEYLFNSIDEYL